jgi:hypothetical protein
MPKLSRISPKNHQPKTTQWSSDDLAKLEKDYASGKRLKVIAAELGRSVSAINKLITRAGIRKNTAPRTNHREQIFQKQNRLQTTTKAAQDQHNNAFAEEKKIYSEYGASFEKVLEYLAKNGVIVTKNVRPFVKKYFHDAVFFVNNRPVSKAELLLIANKIRIEQRLPIFRVCELMLY